MLAARLDLAFELLGGFNEIHDGAELGRCGLGAHADDDLALFNRGAGEDVVAGHALDGKRLAGECRLVDHGRTAYHHAVDAHGHAGARHDEVAHAETLGGHGNLLAVLEAPSVWGMVMRERMSSCSERSRVASSRTSPKSRRNMVLAAVLGLALDKR